MFLRKLTVMVLPLLLLTGLCFLLPCMDQLPLGAFNEAVKGLTLGICLALLVPLSGISGRTESFAPLLLIPSVLILGVLVYQYLETRGVQVEVLHLVATQEPLVLFLEGVFAGYMPLTCLRAGRRGGGRSGSRSRSGRGK